MAAPERVIILLGSTGSGKSWLGNLLVNPEKATSGVVRDQQDFMTSPRGSSCTQQPKWLAPVDQQNTVVVDTPGFDESPAADAEHLLEIVARLRSFGTIAAVLLVLADTRYQENAKKLVKFASKLFPTEV